MLSRVRELLVTWVHRWPEAQLALQREYERARRDLVARRRVAVEASFRRGVRVGERVGYQEGLRDAAAAARGRD